MKNEPEKKSCQSGQSCDDNGSCRACCWAAKIPLMLLLLALAAFAWLFAKGCSKQEKAGELCDCSLGTDAKHMHHKKDHAKFAKLDENAPKPANLEKNSSGETPAADELEKAARASIAKLGEMVEVKSSSQSLNFLVPKDGMESKLLHALQPENAQDQGDQTYYGFDRYRVSGDRLLAKDQAAQQVGNVAKLFQAYPWLRGQLTGFYREETPAAKAQAQQNVARLAADFASQGVKMDTQTALHSDGSGLGDVNLALRYTREAPKPPVEIKVAAIAIEPKPATDVVKPVSEEPKPATDAANVVLPNGESVAAAEGGFEARLLSSLKTKQAEMPWVEFDGVNFETGRARLTSDSTAQLERAKAILLAYPAVHLKVGGYTDNTGQAKANVALSGERAAAVKAYLVKNGIAPERLESEGYGQAHPVASNETAEGRAKNRRVAVKVTKQ